MKQLPRFITFEGSDGCGKTTQLRLLERHLRERGKQTFMTKALGGTGMDFVQNALRSVLLDARFPTNDVETEERLFAVSDARNLSEVQNLLSIEPVTVLQDRGQLSHIVYCVAKGMSFAQIRSYQDFMHQKYNAISEEYGMLNIVLLAESERMVMDRVVSRGEALTPRLENLDMQKAVLGTLNSIASGSVDLNALVHPATQNVFVTVAKHENIPAVAEKILAALKSEGYDV